MHEPRATRDGFGEGLVESGARSRNIVVLTADLGESTRVNEFAKRFPDRFFEVGVAEQALVTIASGLANYGKIPFVTSYAVFSPGRNWEQIRTTIAINNLPVKIIGSHAGVSVGEDGATHQALEDIALMRVLPNMVVVVPADAREAREATIQIAKNASPTYLRLTRSKTPIFTKENDFKIGKASLLWESEDPKVAIIGCGPILWEALQAAKELQESEIGSLVINSHTVKPLDKQAIIKAAKLAGAVVTAEDHQIAGGLGSAIAEVLAQNFPVPIEFIGMHDDFGESGTPDELYQKFHMTSKDIIGSAMKAISRKLS